MGKQIINQLSAAFIKVAQPGRHADGGGLYLYVSSRNARSWVYRWRNGKKRHEMGIGGAAAVSLREARDLAAGLRRDIALGRDPLQARHRRAEAEALSAERTFRHTAAEYLKHKSGGWSNQKHREQWFNTLEAYVYPELGNRPISSIETADVVGVLKPIWATKHETASRVRGRIEVILAYASALGWRSSDNPARWANHLDQVFDPRSKVAPVKHRRALPYTEMVAFIRELRAQVGTAARALEFAILTVCRTSEVLGARWEEFDLGARVWTIPAARMKARRPHVVPLSKPALALLEACRGQSSVWVFRSSLHDSPMSCMAMLQVLRRMQAPCVTHGFRSTFRDWVADATYYPGDLAEAVLAHVVLNKTEAAYRRSTMLEKRAALMRDWGHFCDGLAPTAAALIPAFSLASPLPPSNDPCYPDPTLSAQVGNRPLEGGQGTPMG